MNVNDFFDCILKCLATVDYDLYERDYLFVMQWMNYHPFISFNACR
jgi:hypothetical protein